MFDVYRKTMNDSQCYQLCNFIFLLLLPSLTSIFFLFANRTMGPWSILVLQPRKVQMSPILCSLRSGLWRLNLWQLRQHPREALLAASLLLKAMASSMERQPACFKMATAVQTLLEEVLWQGILMSTRLWISLLLTFNIRITKLSGKHD